MVARGPTVARKMWRAGVAEGMVRDFAVPSPVSGGGKPVEVQLPVAMVSLRWSCKCGRGWVRSSRAC